MCRCGRLYLHNEDDCPDRLHDRIRLLTQALHCITNASNDPALKEPKERVAYMVYTAQTALRS